MARGALGHRLDESVFPQRKPRQTVVAALEFGELARQRHRVDSGDFTDTGIEAHGFEAAGSKPGALPVEARERRGESAADGARRGEAPEDERAHASSARSRKLTKGVPPLIGTA